MALVLGAALPVATGWTQQQRGHDRAPQMRAATDEDLARSVRRNLDASDRTAAFEALEVHVRGGVARIDGRVPTERDRREALRLARLTPGLRSVEDALTVTPAAATEKVVRARVGDVVAEAVTHGIGGVHASVARDEVTLTGMVSSWAERDWLADRVASVAGVKEVHNLVMVPVAPVRPVSRTARALLADVETALSDGRLRKISFSVSSPDRASAGRAGNGVGALPVNALRAVLVEGQEPGDGHVLVVAGRVESLQQRLVIDEVLRDIDGLDTVTNRVRIAPTGHPPDEQVARDAGEALRRDMYLHDDHLRIAVDSGLVVLGGEVDTEFERGHGTDIISRINGVLDIDNQLVTATERRSDEEIARSMRRRLVWSPYVNADDVQIDVVRGVVTVHGNVGSNADWQEVLRHAKASGATRVEDHLLVKGLPGGLVAH